MNYRTILLVIASVIALIAITLVIYKQSVDNVAQPLTEHPTAITQTEPKKTDFGTNKPDDFPRDIPIEKGAEVKQSYSLNYVGQKQLTMVFLSTKTVKENFTLYTDFLKKQNWNLSKEYEGPKVSSLYGTKDNNDINVVISGSTSTGSKSQVSISVLKK